jgi:hypothetical protein
LVIDRFEKLSKVDLHEFADELVFDAPEAVNLSVDFICAETKGNWHGRARAMMCRRLKHCTLTPEQCRRLVTCIMERLGLGRFSEQFRDQLRLAIHLDRQTVFAAARQYVGETSKDHVRRFSKWVLGHDATVANRDAG